MLYETTTLPNGIRIATREMPPMKSVSVGIWVSVGGRHEPEELCGISHFLEHLLFKGTKRRSAKDITEEVEGLGGFINAFTTEDHTCFYAKAGAKQLPVVADVLCDMFLNSVFAEQEIERERDVIREEIPARHFRISMGVQTFDEARRRPALACRHRPGRRSFRGAPRATPPLCPNTQ